MRFQSTISAMKSIFKINRLCRLGLAFALAAALAVRAQTAPVYAQPTPGPAGPSPAAMEQDIQSLQRLVGQLRLDVDALQQQNDNLRKQIITQADVNAAVQNAMSKNLDDTNKAIAQAITQATTSLRKDIIDQVTKQIEALARDTNAQLQTLAQAIGKAPPVSTKVVAVPPSTQPPQDFGQGEVYIVKPNDNLSKIAAHYHVPMTDIEQANHMTPADANNIRTGQSIFIPLKNAAPAPPAATN